MKSTRSAVTLLLSLFMILSCFTGCTGDPDDTTPREITDTTCVETQALPTPSPAEDFGYQNLNGELTVYYKGDDSTVVFPSHIDGFR